MHDEITCQHIDGKECLSLIQLRELKAELATWREGCVCTDKTRAENIGRVEELETRLRDIGDIAHAQSTGPAEVDWLWRIRELAFELL